MILSSLIFFPIFGMIIVMLMPKEKEQMIKYFSVGTSVIPMVISFWLTYDYFMNFSGSAAMAYVEGPFAWIPSLNVNYFLGVDGISVPMLFLTGLLSTISLIASFSIKFRIKEYFAFFLMLEAGMMGVFVRFRFLPLLCLLGNYACAYVFLNRCLGWTTKRICVD